MYSEKPYLLLTQICGWIGPMVHGCPSALLSVPLYTPRLQKQRKRENFKTDLYSVQVTLTSTFFFSYLKFLVRPPKRSIICMFRLPSITTTEHSDQNQPVEERICLTFTSPSPSTIEGNPGRTPCRSRGSLPCCFCE